MAHLKRQSAKSYWSASSPLTNKIGGVNKYVPKVRHVRRTMLTVFQRLSSKITPKLVDSFFKSKTWPTRKEETFSVQINGFIGDDVIGLLLDNDVGAVEIDAILLSKFSVEISAY